MEETHEELDWADAIPLEARDTFLEQELPGADDAEAVVFEGIPIGGFRLAQRIGAFQEGQIWRAIGVAGPGQTPASAVVKTQSLRLAPPGSVRRERFLREAHANMLVRHPHVVEVLEAGEHDSVAYVAREWVDGANLRALAAKIGDAAREVQIVAALGFRIADALATIHRKADRDGVPLHLAHGELSPSTILVGRDGTPKITEGGLTHIDGRALDARHEGRRGKTGYMAPEQVQGRSIDPRTDLFALGIVLVELLGDTPFGGAAGMVPALEDIADAVIRTCTHRSDIPSQLRAMLLRMTALSPAARPESASEVAAGMRAILSAIDRRFLLEAELARLLDPERGTL